MRSSTDSTDEPVRRRRTRIKKFDIVEENPPAIGSDIYSCRHADTFYFSITRHLPSSSPHGTFAAGSVEAVRRHMSASPWSRMRHLRPARNVEETRAAQFLRLNRLLGRA